MISDVLIKEVKITVHNEIIEISVILSNNQIDILKQSSYYFSILLENILDESNNIIIEETNPYQAIQLIIQIIESPNQLNHYNWSCYYAILSSKWLIDSYVNNYRDIMKSHLRDIISFNGNDRIVHDYIPSLYLTNYRQFYSSVTVNMNGYYDISEFSIFPFLFKYINRDDHKIVLTITIRQDSLSKSITTFEMRNELLNFSSTKAVDDYVGFDSFNGEWSCGHAKFNINIQLSNQNIIIFWEIVNVMMSHQHAYGLIEPMHTLSDIYNLILVRNKELCIIDELNKYFNPSEVEFLKSNHRINS